MRLVSTAVVLFVVACRPVAVRDGGDLDHLVRERPQLARFMREMVNVPYAFALLEQGKRPRRVHHAATMLRDAAHDLLHWSDPPVASEAARDVFVAYARNLAHHVGRLELATRDREPAEAAHRLEEIRRTCNNCHRYFRPASRLSRDVAYDHLLVELGGEP